MPKLNLYTVFHLNLAYSSISEEKLAEVIQRCYWPLLNLIEKENIPIAIEATGYTLEKIQELDASWIKKIGLLIKEKRCEFLGSGYAQIIGPLVPARVNEKNLAIGNQVYHSLLGIKPEIAYVNEQTYSQGLIDHYLTAGYRALILEWNNIYRAHSDWDKDWQYFPQYAVNQRGKSMPLIWNNSIAFQKFQRYAHGDSNLKEYLEYLKFQIGKTNRFFSLYGNDAEVFDFRPGRYAQEKFFNKESEWERIRIFLRFLRKDPNFTLVLPSKVLRAAQAKEAFKQLHLESPEQPIPVKKQEKYNITRWSLTGRDSIGMNTKCFRACQSLMKIEDDPNLVLTLHQYEEKYKINLWKELCFLWDSDFRTHIEEKKFYLSQKRLKKLLNVAENILKKKKEIALVKIKKTAPIKVSNQEGLLTINTRYSKVILNKDRGLTIDSLVFKQLSELPVIRTLPHGYYQNILLGADFYTGHTIVEVPGRPKVTDLDKGAALHSENIIQTSEAVEIKTKISVKFGVIKKTVVVYAKEPRVDLKYEFDFKNLPPASFRSGIITFNPEAFNKKTLFYNCFNGGKKSDTFKLGKAKPIIVDPVSLLISARSALGNTEGLLEIGDDQKSIILKTDMARLAALPMVNFIPLEDSFFFRILFSLGETDETSLLLKQVKRNVKYQFYLSIFPKIKS